MTTVQKIAFAAMLGLASLSFAGTNTYNLRLDSPAVAGGVSLGAGSYRMSLAGQVATFTNIETNRSVMVLVRFGSSAESYEHTALEVKSNRDGVQRIEAIELEDSTSRLEF